MNRFVGIASVFLAALSLGCASTEITLPPGPSVPLVRLRAEPYSFAYNSGLSETARLVVRDPAAWQAVWSQIHFGRSPTPALPAVDFSREMIIVVALGSRATGGYSIMLAGASETAADGTVVTVISSSPGPMCGTTQAVTQPVDIARVPLRGGRVSFIERNQVTNCG